LAKPEPIGVAIRTAYKQFIHATGQVLTDRGDEDLSSSTEQIVEGIGNPYTKQGGGNEWGGIDESDNPLVSVTLCSTDLVNKVEFGRKGQV
jgi:hypothetical protein